MFNITARAYSVLRTGSRPQLVTAESESYILMLFLLVLLF